MGSGSSKKVVKTNSLTRKLNRPLPQVIEDLLVTNNHNQFVDLVCKTNNVAKKFAASQPQYILPFIDKDNEAVNADGFLARDITFENAAGPGSQQAVAVRVDSDHSAFYNCAFLGHQDTLYTHILRQFYRNCRIEGTVDFIFGDSAAIFENCLVLLRPRQINSDKGSTDPVTAQGRTDPAEPTGFVFHNCTINGTEEYMRAYHANPKIYKGYLGRPWKMYSRAIFINSYLGEAISPEGWMPWIGDFALNTLYYGEYQNYGPGAKVSGRTPWSNQIPERSVGMYTVGNFIQGDEWLRDTNN